MTQTKQVNLRVTPGLFRGLASQNMLFHQCIVELVDNSIAAAKESDPFRVDIILDRQRKNPDLVNVWIADNTSGMDVAMLEQALQPGESPETGSHLNEHGFGLKNSLATLCYEAGDQWDIWTRPRGASGISHVQGPFKDPMDIEMNLEDFPRKAFLPGKMSTLIRAQVPFNFIKTVRQTVRGKKRRGKQPTDLLPLKAWLVEHLGVLYRGYLGVENTAKRPLGEIYVKIGNKSTQVEALPVPMAGYRSVPFEIELGGEVQKLLYRFGVIDDDITEEKGHQFYYQGNMDTQGIDIRLGNRVIITRQLEAIWPLERDNHYNKFVGELIIPELPPGILKTTKNKTDFNLNDPEWEKIFSYMVDNLPTPPEDKDRDMTEAELRRKWKSQLEAQAEPGEVVCEEIQTAWEAAVSLDLYKKKSDGCMTVYELKRVAAKPQDLYQLKMYWDGLVLRGDNPTLGVLIAESFNDRIKEMAKTMNQRLRPPENKESQRSSSSYNFTLKTLVEVKLLDENGNTAKEKKGKKR